MALKLIELDDGGIMAVGKGRVTKKDIMKINSYLYNDKNINKYKYHIFNLESGKLDITEDDDFWEIAKQDMDAVEKQPVLRIAAVLGNEDNYIHALSWLHHTQDDESHFRLFRTLEDAKEWLKK